jgi:hypothetical protein
MKTPWYEHWTYIWSSVAHAPPRASHAPAHLHNFHACNAAYPKNEA